MPAVLSTPRPRTFQFARRPKAITAPRPRASGAKLAQVLCGGGLVAYGLLRGSWPGLALAAVGGFLVYRGLTSSPAARANRRPLFRQDDWQADVPARPPSVVLPPVQSESRPEEVVGEAAAVAPPAPPPGPARARELTPAEHAEAEVVAYYHALYRGGGRLPPYEHVMAVEDFCRAAEVVVTRRAGG